MVLKAKRPSVERASDTATPPIAAADNSDPAAVNAAPVRALPQLLDLGADKCVPCKAMAPILQQLKRDFDGRFDLTFIDVWENPTAGEAHGIRIIPTQIFYDAEGHELFRHEGFYSREEILAKWRELGFDFEGPAGADS
ncbi:MAG: thioredoxin family protein [Phycisphaeraceae bacterium]|nr:thioredoxin family protein [Phycisphaeraceae bacterium]